MHEQPPVVPWLFLEERCRGWAQGESQRRGTSCGPSSRHWGFGVCARYHEASRIITFISAIWRQPVDAKWSSVRRQKPTRRQEQEIGLVQPHHLLHGALPSSGRANEISPMVPMQYPGEELSAARRTGIDQKRQPFLAWRS